MENMSGANLSDDDDDEPKKKKKKNKKKDAAPPPQKIGGLRPREYTTAELKPFKRVLWQVSEADEAPLDDGAVAAARRKLGLRVRQPHGLAKVRVRARARARTRVRL